MLRLLQITLILGGVFLFLAAQKAPVKNLLQTSDGNYVIIENQVVQASKMLSREDAATLVDLEAKGFKQYKFLKRKIFKKAINHTVTKHTKSKKKAIPTEVESLLAKYNPQDVGDGYFIVDNRVVQKCQPLTKKDFQALQDIASRTEDGIGICDYKVAGDVIVQTVIKKEKAKIKPALLDRFTAVMKKYQR